MGLLSSIFGSSKSNSSTASTTTNRNSSFGIGGDNNGLAVSGNGNNITLSDNGAIEGAFGLVKDAMTGQSYMFNEFTTATTQVASDAINAVGMANDGANALSELAIMQAGENSNTFMSLAGDIVESNANLGRDYGDNLAYLTDTSIAGNQYLTEKSMDMADIAMTNNASLISQFGADMSNAFSGYRSELSDLTSLSMNNNATLTSQFGSDLTDLTSQTQNALVEMAQLQETGLDNALQIAGSLGTEDNSEASTNMVKYVMLGVGALGVAMVFRK